jgi:acetyltransferase-like isoleucine patch superfamily enzyme
MPGIIIGEGAIIAANTVVTKEKSNKEYEKNI